MQSGRATEKTDVYSFGVLVLEVLSGKRPTDASFIEKGLNIVGWVCFFPPNFTDYSFILLLIVINHLRYAFLHGQLDKISFCLNNGRFW